MGETLKPEPGQQLHVGVVHDLSTALLVHGVRVVGHPEGVAHMQVVHVSVKINVLSEVRDAVVLCEGPADSLTPVNNHQVLVGHFDAVVVHQHRVGGRLSHLHHKSLVDDMAVDEEIRVDLVRGRNGDAATVCPMEYASSKGIHEHATVNALPQPARSPDEYVEVFSEVQDLEDLDSLLDVQLVSVDENFTTREHAHFEGVDELLHDICLLQYYIELLVTKYVNVILYDYCLIQL